MASKKVVMFDVDGVLANCNSVYAELAAEKVNNYMLPMHPRESPGWFTMQERLGDDAPKIFNYVWEQPEVLDSAIPLFTPEQAVKINHIQSLASTYFVTNRGPGSKRVTEIWLERHLRCKSTVIVSSRKDLVAEAIGADFSIEDHAPNAIMIAMASPRTRSYLLHRPYNEIDAKRLGACVQIVLSLDTFLDDVLRAIGLD